ncbi:MAG: biopolymer transporter ExbD [Gammaproteobacteria bacterium]|nr:biopolymer transporter ExbD [Gammaproteobacteria bacterium]MDE0415021.1 biopolymer transporter ExbD [Gammaproteobacteria bacterium]
MRKSIIQAAGEDGKAEINLTPMLDVVFIMLIFFIVTASFIKEVGIDVNRPDQTPQEKPEDANILVAISAGNEIWIDRRRVDPRAVRANIQRLHAEDPKRTVIIQTDKRAYTETLVGVMDSARQAGVFDVSIAASDD